MRTEARGVATLVMIQILTMHLTLPVDMRIAHDLTTSLDTCHILWTTGPVLIEQQHRGPCLAHSLEHLTERVAASKKQQQHSNIGLGRILHNRLQR